MIAFARIASVVLVIHVLEACFLWPFSSYFALIDLLLLYVAIVAAPRGAGRGGAIGAAIGLFRGLAGAGAVTAETLAFGAAAAFAGWAYRKLVGETTFGLFLILFGTVIVHDLVRGIPTLSQGLSPLFFTFVLKTVPAGIVTGGIGAGVLFLVRRAGAPQGAEA